MVQPWITVDQLGNQTDPDTAAWAVEAATWILYKLTGEKYAGINSTTEVYSRRQETLGFPVKAQIIGGEIVHVPTGRSARTNRIRLNKTPARSIEMVRVGGRILDKSSYQLRNNMYLVRTGNGTWDSALNSEIEVTYTYGTEPPAMGITAAIRLANELIWNDQDSELCTLPERISSSVTRQGVSYTILDPQEFLDKGRTGVTVVDMFITASNPSRAKKRPRVFSPTAYRAERIN